MDKENILKTLSEIARCELSQLYFELTSKRMLATFYHDTNCRRLYKNSNTMTKCIANIVFRNPQKRMRVDAYRRVKEILKCYEDWKKEYDCFSV